MEPITVPTTDVNSEQAVLNEWYAGNTSPVRRGEAVAEVETSKSVIEVDAPIDGFLLHDVDPGEEFDLDRPIGRLFASLDELDAARAAGASPPPAPPNGFSGNGGSPRASRSAVELAEAHGIDLGSIGKPGLITRADVEASIEGERPAPVLADLPDPVAVDDGRRRIVVIGAGLGATQVMDILGHDEEQVAVGLVDDDASAWGTRVDDVPVLGGADRLADLLEQGAFDAAIVSISTSVAARHRLREHCERLGIPLANAVDPTARLARGVRLGQGNVICAFCHFGVGTTVGDNNFISAYNSYDHHSVIGSDVSTGPGCMTSGLVTVGDRVRMGTGIFVEPKLVIGHGAVIASGSVVVRSVPDDHVLKARSGATVASPVKARS